MATGLSFNAVIGVETLLYSGNKDFADTTHQFSASFRRKFTFGTGQNQCNLFYEGYTTLAGSASLALDLVGTTQDPLNNNIAMLTVKFIYLVNVDENGNAGLATLTVGGGSNPISGLFGANTQQLKVPPAGAFEFFCGEVGGLATCVAGTGDMLNITNGAAGQSRFQLIIAGTTV